ncbi:MAG: class I tRNA ligase family protein [Patescibacteria group bacterium]
MTDEFPTRYDPQEAEPRIYSQWEKSGYFNPDRCVEDGITSKEADYFSLVLPPPNVTGTLHLGHAFEDTVQDIIIRYNRMRGKRTLWIPGTDHAAIATQAKVESVLNKEEKKNRHDLGREEFLRRVREFAEKSHDTIVKQVKRIGASLDWSREAYTLDEKRSSAVKIAFERMYGLGLIYRGARIVNWDPRSQTTVSDDEVVHEETNGLLYTFRYDKDFPIAISTTRPETKVGDVAVAVNPKDERYKEYVGKEYKVKFVDKEFVIKIVADENIDPAFGTGAVGVTPAHSLIDWEIAEKNSLPYTQVIDEQARMTEAAGPLLVGKKTLEAREIMVTWLKQESLMEKEEEIKLNLSKAERSGGTIEPLPKLQWFIDVGKPFILSDSKIEGISSGETTTLKEIMKQAVSGGQVKIIPDRFEKVYFHWIENLRDWCISRQLWFGHRIPVWYCLKCGVPTVNAQISSKWFLVRHGETDDNKEHRASGGGRDVPLNEVGVAQAEKAAEILKGQNIGLIISSHLTRAKQTAEIIAKATGAEIIYDEELRERYMGKVEGVHHDEIKELYPSFWIDYHGKSAENESYHETGERVHVAFKKHRDSHDGMNVVVVSHGGAIRTLLKHLKNLTPEETLTKMHLIPNATPIPIDILSQDCTNCGEKLFEQDPDTLDTWFSSGMWTFSTLGWPEKTKDLETYHPNSFMAPGYEIIFMWVARMILMSGALIGEVPFRTVYFHGIVRDKNGQKFSKSKGNGIDPIDMAEKYGADALRMALIAGASPGNDVKFDEDRVRGYRNFATKIWNASRFLVMNKPDSARPETITPTKKDKEILDGFLQIKSEVAKHIEEFDFHLASEKTYHYFWHTFADKIIEEAKSRLKGDDMADQWAAYDTLEQVLLGSLIMLHPFMPFVTEEIYQKFRPEKMLLVERWD